MKIFILWIKAKDVFPFVGVFSTFEKALNGAKIYRAKALQEASNVYWRHLEIAEIVLNDVPGRWVSTNVRWDGEKAITWPQSYKPIPRPEWLLNFDEYREELGFGPPDFTKTSL